MIKFDKMCLSHLFIIWALLCSAKAVHVLIDTFKAICPGHNEKSRMYVSNNQFVTVNHTTYISHKFTTFEDIPGELKIELYPTRCKSKDALDTCETYRTYTLRNVCHYLVSDQAPWSPFVKKYDPPVVCPLKKGVNVLNNGTLDPTALPQWAKSYWKVETVLREQENNAFIGCTYTEFQIV